jgi:hypothetical protein
MTELIQDPNLTLLVELPIGKPYEQRVIRIFEPAYHQSTLACDHRAIQDAYMQSLRIKRKLSGLSELEKQLYSTLLQISLGEPK